MKCTLKKIHECADINSSSINPVKLPYEYINYYDISSVGSGFLGEISMIKVDKAPLRARRVVECGDSIVSMVRPGNKTYYYFNECTNQDIVSTGFAVLHPRESIIDSKYLYYAITNHDFISYLVQNEKGATYPAVDERIIANGMICVYDLDIQKKIGNILSVYDDLIKNNQKQIQLLEEAAQRYYKEWFVKFHFPRHENIKIVDGVPEGWQYKLVNEFGAIITGKTPPTSNAEYYGGNIPFVTIPDMHNKVFPLMTEKTLTKVGADTQKNKYIPINSVIVSCIATVGLVNIAVEPCQTNQQINSVVLHNKNDLYFFYESMKRIKDLLAGVGSNGATMTNVNKTKFSNIKVLYPTEDLVIKYNKFCKPLFDKILTLSKAILLLSKARDLLLPKLMNGEIDI